MDLHSLLILFSFKVLGFIKQQQGSYFLGQTVYICLK